ncbi:MAG TPA: hypothetical protein VFH63_06470 [candidate division Zixibacteria bacterium]|nr:hypothetical protein [candidate division Zixibacteria bacterium]
MTQETPLEALRPQQATPSDAVVLSVEWLFEPAWRGERLLARMRDGRVTLTDEEGHRVGPELSEAAEVLEAALRTEDALVDGIWTAMPFVGAGSAAQHLAEAIEEEGLTGEVPDPIANEPRRAFVAIDLIELDGQSLHDIPYQERRRLLGAVVEEDVRVRISPAVRVPIHNWLTAWRASGFTHYVAKHMNSRYQLGGTAEDWLLISTAERRGPSPVGRLFGMRPKKVVHIEDGEDPRARR